ncbi:hypothetical protein TNCV_2482791 [Trichonephila clavipes]|uniref:Uncharacterized protein n=1 Tax=Trichonephila clavipes TaxID=2585209 RepID=A0A8X7BAW4_TRICX|nr:hypothetical protein TNCV_2482791 [Trichonephila clavipes]
MSEKSAITSTEACWSGQASRRLATHTCTSLKEDTVNAVRYRNEVFEPTDIRRMDWPARSPHFHSIRLRVDEYDILPRVSKRKG